MYISEISFYDITILIHDIINCIRDIWNWIYDSMKLNIDMYISWIPITHITNSGLNSKTAFHTRVLTLWNKTTTRTYQDQRKQDQDQGQDRTIRS